MKKAIFILVVFLYSISCYSQFYEYSIDKGQDPYMYYFRGEAAHPYQAPQENELSEWQVLPFDWNFFGETVSGYFISDNGYITFDENATESISSNTELFDAIAPNNSIFAFWTDLHLEDGNTSWSNEVAVATIGTTPERVHIIYWMRVVPAGQVFANENLSFFICLYEQGSFDIGYTVKSGSEVYTATVGVKNSDGTESLNIAESPEYVFPECGFGDSDDTIIMVREKTSSDIEDKKLKDIQAFPNPFTESTTIEYYSYQPGQVKLEIYNALGNKVSTVTDEYKTAGSHRAIIDGDEFIEGLYYYRFVTVGVVQSGTLVFIK